MKFFSGLNQKITNIAKQVISYVVAKNSNSFSGASSSVVSAPKVKTPVGSVGKTTTSASAVSTGKEIHNQAYRVYEKARKKFFKEFEDSVVTKEIESGPTGSSSLFGYGDLFSFIGFKAGSKPISYLRNFLQENIVFTDFRGTSNNSNIINFEFGVKFPTREDFVRDGGMNLIWEAGNPWPLALEEGIIGYEFYLSFIEDMPKSISKRGLQNTRPIDDRESFPKINYVKDLLQKFEQDLKSSGVKFKVIK